MKTAQEYYQEFLTLKEMPLPQRARGLKLNTVRFWHINFFLLMGAVTTPLAWYLRENYEPIFWLFVSALAWFIWYFPEYLYHQEHRRKRYLKRNYPQVYRAVRRLRNKGETILYDIPPLHIEGKTYFLVSYAFRQPWWQRRPWVRLTGWMLFDDQGNPVQDAALFAKAFVTMAYADTGAVTAQEHNEQLIIELRFALRKYLPRAERLLKRKEEFLRSEGFTYEWHELTKRFPLFYEAVKDAMPLYDFEMKFAKAIGYSFGYDIWYDDAVHMEKVYRAYGEYMHARYYQALKTAIDPHLISIWRGLRWNAIDRYILNLLGKTLEMVIKSCIWFPQNAGIPTVSEWEAYLRRLEVARQKGFTVIEKSPLPEEYPFKGVLYHDEPFRAGIVERRECLKSG